jgi:hypothetical protein
MQLLDSDLRCVQVDWLTAAVHNAHLRHAHLTSTTPYTPASTDAPASTTDDAATDGDRGASMSAAAPAPTPAHPLDHCDPDASSENCIDAVLAELQASSQSLPSPADTLAWLNQLRAASVDPSPELDSAIEQIEGLVLWKAAVAAGAPAESLPIGRDEVDAFFDAPVARRAKPEGPHDFSHAGLRAALAAANDAARAEPPTASNEVPIPALLCEPGLEGMPEQRPQHTIPRLGGYVSVNPAAQRAPGTEASMTFSTKLLPGPLTEPPPPSRLDGRSLADALDSADSAGLATLAEALRRRKEAAAAADERRVATMRADAERMVAAQQADTPAQQADAAPGAVAFSELQPDPELASANGSPAEALPPSKRAAARSSSAAAARPPRKPCFAQRSAGASDGISESGSAKRVAAKQPAEQDIEMTKGGGSVTVRESLLQAAQHSSDLRVRWLAICALYGACLVNSAATRASLHS